jgi:hypothetical protein
MGLKATPHLCAKAVWNEGQHSTIKMSKLDPSHLFHAGRKQTSRLCIIDELLKSFNLMDEKVMLLPHSARWSYP